HERVKALAKQAGLEYNFDIAVVANSFDAHRFIQLAKSHYKGDAAEELLFKAYFTEGKNIADKSFLQSLGEAIGIEAVEIENMLNTQSFAEAVQKDIAEADQIGIHAVPYFVFNRKYAISGAQPDTVFLQALQQVHAESDAAT
ncbi:MAG: DsbA family protein, partial [Chitinophagales bacterium]